MSGKHIHTIPAILVLGSLFISLSAGCGTRVGPNGDPNETPPPAAQPTPTPAATASVAPTPVPTPVVPTPAPELTASQSGEFKKGSIFGWLSKSKVDVLVNNPSPVQLTGTVKVTFTSGGSPTEDLTREVTLGAGQTQTLNFTATKKNPDAAEISVATNPPPAAAPAPAPGAAIAGYPQTYGRY